MVAVEKICPICRHPWTFNISDTMYQKWLEEKGLKENESTFDFIYGHNVCTDCSGDEEEYSQIVEIKDGIPIGRPKKAPKSFPLRATPEEMDQRIIEMIKDAKEQNMASFDILVWVYDYLQNYSALADGALQDANETKKRDDYMMKKCVDVYRALGFKQKDIDKIFEKLSHRPNPYNVKLTVKTCEMCNNKFIHSIAEGETEDHINSVFYCPDCRQRYEEEHDVVTPQSLFLLVRILRNEPTKMLSEMYKGSKNITTEGDVLGVADKLEIQAANLVRQHLKERNSPTEA